MVKNQGTKQRVQRILGDCWQWESNGQCSRGDNCSFRHDINKREKMSHPNPSPNSFMQQNERKSSRTRSPRGKNPRECFDGPARITSKELAPIHSVKKWHPPECLFYKPKSGCRFGEMCSYAHHQVDEQPSKRSKKNDDKSAVAMLKITRQLSRRSLHRFRGRAQKKGKPIRCVQFTKAVVRHADIRDQNPSLGMICPGNPRQRDPNAPKFEDRSIRRDGMARAMCP